MPINRRWPLSEVIAEIRKAQETQDHEVLLQYTLISGVNDSADHAKALAELIGKNLRVKVNLIPLNEIDPSRFRSPAKESVERFRDHLHRTGIRVMVRYSKGQDIAAACGQLVTDPSRTS
jgi:23S rRNA (adenine2503-C2)-methyltransferase